MIIGIFLRNYKIYDQLYFVPFSQGDSFTGLIGDNGTGKTTLLQALNSFFNDLNWERNIKKERSDDSFIQPVFLVEKSAAPQQLKDEADQISSYLWSFCNYRNYTQNVIPFLKYFRNLSAFIKLLFD